MQVGASSVRGDLTTCVGQITAAMVAEDLSHLVDLARDLRSVCLKASPHCDRFLQAASCKLHAT